MVAPFFLSKMQGLFDGRSFVSFWRIGNGKSLLM
jgi:hypothetical protein